MVVSMRLDAMGGQMKARLCWGVLCLCSFLFNCTSVWAQDRPVGEADQVSSTFPPLTIDSLLLNFADTEFADLAHKIQLGTASMQERRAFYRAADRYAPF